MIQGDAQEAEVTATAERTSASPLTDRAGSGFGGDPLRSRVTFALVLLLFRLLPAGLGRRVFMCSCPGARTVASHVARYQAHPMTAA